MQTMASVMINYQLTYGESYNGLLNGAPPIIIADFPHVTSLLAAFNSLLMDNYHAFILKSLSPLFFSVLEEKYKPLLIMIILKLFDFLQSSMFF